MKSTLIVAVLAVTVQACVLSGQVPHGLLSRPEAEGASNEFAAVDSLLATNSLPEEPSPIWSTKEMAPPPCGDPAMRRDGTSSSSMANGEPCTHRPTPFRRFMDSRTPLPMTPAQKGRLALRNLIDPGNFATIAGSAAFTGLTNAHSAYGPGLIGFGRGVGVGLLGDATGQFFGTFAIPSLTHEDPHYHRMPHASVPRRVVHAISRTVIAQSDTGRPMLNYATLGTYPISAELSNLYVPGIHGNGPSTVARIMTGYATDPVDNLITEFLPDVARHVHVHVVFAQQIVNQVSSDQVPALP